MNELATLVKAGREKRQGMAAADLLSAELIDLTRSELFAIVPETGRTFPFVPATLVPRLLERGVAVRVLHSCEAEWETPGFAALERMGAAMRSTILLPHSIVIRDRSFLYISHPDASHPMSRQLTRVRNDVLARLFAVTFDAIWSASASRRDDGATGEFRDLARLLNQGLTDDRAAARLHMSRRTFARRMASMMDLLDAESRFQAGVQAATRGWL
jgi:AraC-like DNA-binding protein